MRALAEFDPHMEQLSNSLAGRGVARLWPQEALLYDPLFSMMCGCHMTSYFAAATCPVQLWHNSAFCPYIAVAHFCIPCLSILSATRSTLLHLCSLAKFVCYCILCLTWSGFGMHLMLVMACNTSLAWPHCVCETPTVLRFEL